MSPSAVNGIVVKDESYDATSRISEMDESAFQSDMMHIRWFLCFEFFPLHADIVDVAEVPRAGVRDHHIHSSIPPPREPNPYDIATGPASIDEQLRQVGVEGRGAQRDSKLSRIAVVP